MVAKIVRAYLSSMTRLIKAHDGEVRSFDGDRVMGVFIGGSKNTNAANCALKMAHTVNKILRPRAEKQFPSLVEKNFKIEHCAGVAASEVLVVRGGVRESNDLVFVGLAPNLAAKLSALRTGHDSWITRSVYDTMHDKARFTSTVPPKNMWTPVTKTVAGENWRLYGSTWMRTP